MDLLAPLDPGWERALAAQSDAFEHVGAALRARRDAGEHVLPAPEDILRAFRQPFDDVRVLVLGQDPYPTPGHPIGMCFAVDRRVRPLPRSWPQWWSPAGAGAGWGAPKIAWRAPGTPYSYGPPTTCGTSGKLKIGGGDSICHSRVIARHGLLPASGPWDHDQIML